MMTIAAATESGDININHTGDLTIGTVNGTAGVEILDAAANDATARH